MSSEMPSSESAPASGADAATAAAAPVPRASDPATAAVMSVYTLTTFLSALLLFSIQPLFAKMVLPILGGAPSVWAVALCFFQGALLAGYCYAHLVNRHVPAQHAGFVHLAVVALALVSLPIGLPAGWREPPPGDPYLWQLGLFTVAIGLPFLAVSANAPLLQAWFARTRHPNARDPYFLYAASNLGSFSALLAFPFLLEPAFGLTQLSHFWTIGFVLLWLALALCFWSLLRSGTSETAIEHQPGGASVAAPAWRDRLGWVGLALVPSALLTAFTTHIATDIASAPLIWVLPLSLYLLTFVLVFRERVFVPRPLLLALHMAAVIVALLQMAQTKHDSWFVSSATGVAAFFLSGLVAHRTLYEARPAARYLTQFYLFLSLGGVLGGLFAGLIAPKLFTEVLEYPILLALTMACRPGVNLIGIVTSPIALILRALGRPLPTSWKATEVSADELLTLWLVVAIGALAIFWLPVVNESLGWQFGEYGMTAALAAVSALVLLAFYRYPARQLVAALLMCGVVVGLPSSVNKGDAIEKQRSYFGVYRVSETSDREFHILTHGTTLHGAQRVRDREGTLIVDTTPTTYYHPASPMAKSVELVRERITAEGGTGRYGVIGLGTGSLACLAKPGEHWRFFEIDPVVVRISMTPQIFSYLYNCQPQPDIALGDARLTLAKEPPGSFDLIIVDAFSSDAVPMHLLTAEALRMYAEKLTPKGVALLHISNRYLDLDSVLAATLPLVPGLDGLLISDDEADGSYAATTSTVGVFSRSREALQPFRALEQATELEEVTMRGWTDDYSDVLRPFLSKLKR